MIGCLSLGRETFDVDFANEKINSVEKKSDISEQNLSDRWG